MNVTDDVEVRSIPSFPGYYADSAGNIWSSRIHNANRRTYSGLRKLKSSLNSRGYLVVSLYRNRKQYLRQVHLLVNEAFHGLRPKEDSVTRHKDGVKTNNTPLNLKWGTQKENCEDKKLHGTSQVGERNGHSKYSWEIVRQIRADYSSGKVTQTALGIKYKIKQGYINKIVLNKSWIDETYTIPKMRPHPLLTNVKREVPKAIKGD